MTDSERFLRAFNDTAARTLGEASAAVQLFDPRESDDPDWPDGLLTRAEALEQGRVLWRVLVRNPAKHENTFRAMAALPTETFEENPEQAGVQAATMVAERYALALESMSHTL